MQIYIVRHAHDFKNAPFELVGIFAVTCLSNLRHLVDQVSDPNVCEYARLSEGGLIWTGRAPSAPMLAPSEDHDSTEYRKFFDTADLDDGWQYQICNGDGLNWRLLVDNKNGWLPGAGLIPDHVDHTKPLAPQLAE